jgi:hypothetical protein
MDDNLLSRIRKYKAAGWRIGPDGIASYGIGSITSPQGDFFTLDEILSQDDFLDTHKDVRDIERFRKLSTLIMKFYDSLTHEEGLSYLFENS